MEEYSEISSKSRIMIVDDNDHFRTALAFILNNNFSDKIEYIEQAANGKDFLEKLKLKIYDLVFMDLDMPEMDGATATKIAVDNYRGIKIIAVSFHSEFDNMLKMIEAGARNYIVKEEISKESLAKYFTDTPENTDEALTME